ncbi:MAG: CRTAC1 family protein [Pseudomonadota bacterium]
MKYSACVLSLLLASEGAAADPLFEAVPDALPVQHVYSGGWEHFVGGGLAILDCNNDARPDLFAAGGTTPARLFINASTQGQLRFEEAKLPSLTGVTGAWPLDIDGDTVLDLAVLRVGPNMLLRGLGNCAFEDMTRAWGLDAGDQWSTAFSATWEAGRDWPTLAVGNYVDRDDPDGPFGACDDNAIYRPGLEGFAAPIALSPGYCALSMLISDWQRTGTPELRISNDRHYYVRDGFEEMWRLSPLTPRAEADGWEKVALWGMGIASGDVTGDGLPEVMLTSMGDQLLQINHGTRWSAAPYAMGTTAHRPHLGEDGRPSTGWHAEFADVDNDGRLDLFIAKGNVDQMPENPIEDPNTLLMQQADGTFAEAAGEAGIASVARSRGAGLADFDGDGRVDLAVVNRRAAMEVWRNVTQSAGAWLAIEPRSAGSNTRAVGAWVEVRTDAGIQAREVTVGGGHGGGQSGPLHFGLGGASAAELRVIWPDGTTSDWIETKAGQHIRAHPNGTELVLTLPAADG